MSSVFLLQQNFAVGDIEGNIKRLLTGAKEAASQGAVVALSPELSLTGYPPEDLLYHLDFQKEIDGALEQLAHLSPPELALVVGFPLFEESHCYNACAVLRGGRIEGVYRKTALPNYSIFDEKRYFEESNNPPFVFSAGGEDYMLQICQDIWSESNHDIRATNTLVLNGSPYVMRKQCLREQAVKKFAQAKNTRVYYINFVGACDELVFDGASFVIDSEGHLLARLPAFSEFNGFATEVQAYEDDSEESIYEALKLGLSDYMKKTAFAKGVILGLSGGVDSALVATLAVDALGADKVTAVMLSTRFTSAISYEGARQIAKNLGIRYWEIDIENKVEAFRHSLYPYLKVGEATANLTDENIQSRVRGVILMALSNAHNLMLLATGNKSEMAVGYATLYGDMNGGFAPIKDVLKTQVWKLCHYLNSERADNRIPEYIINRPPSAELKEEQLDQDSLPSYALLDAILTDFIERMPLSELNTKYDQNEVQRFCRLLLASEHKRRQAPLGPKISECALGRDWRMPIANSYRYGH